MILGSKGPACLSRPSLDQALVRRYSATVMLPSADGRTLALTNALIH